MKNTIKLLLLAAVLPITSAHATTYVNYYVGGAGASDANSGISSGSPWATIAKVNSFRFPANSIIHQQASLTGSLVLDGGGNAINATPANPITYIANQFTLTGSTSGSGSATVTLNNVPVNFSGAIIRGTGTTNYGIKITGKTSGIVTGNDVGGFALDQTNGGTEILVFTSGTITVSQNKVHGLAGATSHDDFGILSNGSTGNVTISGNTVYNIGGFASGPGGYSG